MQDFDYQLRPRIIFGPNSIERLGSLAKELHCHRALIVSDPGVMNVGIFSRGQKSLTNAGISTEGFHDLKENPTTLHVANGLRVAREFKPDLIVGLGGGSSMDCAKGINFLYSCGGRMQDYWGVGKATKAMLPMIAVPTTAGTGSETQSFALISDETTHVKMACGDPKAACRIALLDPELTVSQPSHVTALTGIDAITHALETYVCTKSNPISECYSREAWQLLSQGFSQVLSDGNDLVARSKMQLGACFAGMAIEASMLGAAHALANPLTALLGVPHGQAVGLMMPHVVRFNAMTVQHHYEDLSKMIPDSHLQTPSECIAQTLQNWMQQAGLAIQLTQLPQWPGHLVHQSSETEKFIGTLAESASKQWTATFNPRPVNAPELLDMYRAAL